MLLVHCPQCGYDKYAHDFNRFNFKYNRFGDHKINFICNNCDAINTYAFKKTERILKGKFLPVYEKPVKKYFIAPTKLNK